MHPRLANAAVAVLAASTLASAAVLQNCVSGKICYSVAVPEASARAGSGDLFFQIQAPASNAWAALGQGTAMAGARIFVMYADGAGNVTVSPRLATGYAPPRHDAAAATLTLLAGSGVDAGTGLMVANVKCANCSAAWAGGGTMDLAGASTHWVAAWKAGAALASADPAAAITKHDATAQFTWDLTQATITADANPFAGAAAVAATTSGASAAAASTAALPTIVAAHGVVMAALFVVLWPVASLLMPILGKWMVHAAFQMANFVMMWVGYGLGVYAANGLGIGLKSAHTQIGTAVCWAMLIQPALGWFHHRHYLRHQARGAVSHAHVWYGRALVLLGLVNVGLGLQLTSASATLMGVYAILAAVVGAFYASIKIFTLMMRRNAATRSEEEDLATMRKIPSYPKDARFGAGVHEVEMQRYPGISRPIPQTYQR